MQSPITEAATVLLIDNNTLLLGEMSTCLASAGHICHGAVDPESAQQLAAEVAPDLIISDLHLGAAHSHEEGPLGEMACDKIRQLPGLEQVPVMFLSASQVPDVIRRTHGAAGVYCLRKPCEQTILLALAEQALRVPVLTQ